jgi:ribosomal protein S12 methylthiotransferase accessory factor
VPKSFRFCSSFRAEPLEVTLARAQSLAADLGISRVTDITRLDYVGVPVFASIRPDAQPGSLCVNAGKGITLEEARVGAYMEAVEYAFAEPRRANLEVIFAPAGQVYDGRTRADAILDFCPMMGAEIDLQDPIPCVKATDICSGEEYLVPAELVFLPYPAKLKGKRYFGANSNGLCSGNSVLEATVHGLAEVIERDITSFQAITDNSTLVENDTLPPPIRRIGDDLGAAGLGLYVRYVQNCFRLPYFMAAVAERSNPDPIYITVGYGCHPCKDIAVTRAVTEALQSRLSFIHGGRDDLVDRYDRFRRWSNESRTKYANDLLAQLSRNGSSIRFRDVADQTKRAGNIESSLTVLMESLALNGFRHVLRVVYTPDDSQLHVVRILVPGLECFTEGTARVGVRLRDYVREQI